MARKTKTKAKLGKPTPAKEPAPLTDAARARQRMRANHNTRLDELRIKAASIAMLLSDDGVMEDIRLQAWGDLMDLADMLDGLSDMIQDAVPWSFVCDHVRRREEKLKRGKGLDPCD